MELHGREMADEFCLKMPDFHLTFRDILQAAKYRRFYFPSEGRRAEDFLVLKNPTTSVGFEPSHLGTKGQHATSRPPNALAHLFVNKYIITRPTCFL